MIYTVSIPGSIAEKLTVTVLQQVKKDTASLGIKEACDIIITHLVPFQEPDEYADSGFTDDFGINLE